MKLVILLISLIEIDNDAIFLVYLGLSIMYKTGGTDGIETTVKSDFRRPHLSL